MNQAASDALPESGIKVRRYVLTVLVVVYTFNFIARQLLSILLESIKLELGLSDQALGFLVGFLASGKSSYITGTTILVDGGLVRSVI